MATEQDELRVRVSLQDDATQRLVYLRDSINQVTGGGGAAGGLHGVAGQVGEMEKAIAKLAQEALGIGRRTQDMARAFGIAPVAMGLVGYEAGRLSTSMGKMSLGLRDLGNAARVSGQTIGQLQSAIEGFAQAGVPKADAVRSVQNFAQAVYQISIPGSATRQELINSAGKYRGEMIRFLDTLVSAKDPVDQLNAAIQASWNVHDWEIKLGHSEIVARQAQNDALRKMGIDPATVQSRALIEKMDERRAARMKTMTDRQTELGKQLAIKAATEERISTAISAANAVWETWAAKQITFFEDHLLKDLQAMEDKGVVHGLFDHFLDTPHGLQWLPRMFTAPSWMVGDKPKVDPDAWKTTHHEFGGDTAKLPEKTDANTKEVQRLTDNVKKMVEKGWGAPPGTPLKAMAKGGVVKGPTPALVGEKGPEAIVGKDGTKVIDRPTVTVLGAQGAQAVIPLGADPNQKDRPRYYSGTATVPGSDQVFHFGSGGVGKGSLPYGTYAIDFSKEGIGPKGAAYSKHGFVDNAVAGLNDVGKGNVLSDPNVGARTGIEVHPARGHDLDHLYTQGCFGVSPDEWPDFKKALLNAAADAPGGKMYLTVNRGEAGATASFSQSATPSTLAAMPAMADGGVVVPPNEQMPQIAQMPPSVRYPGIEQGVKNAVLSAASPVIDAAHWADSVTKGPEQFHGIDAIKHGANLAAMAYGPQATGFGFMGITKTLISGTAAEVGELAAYGISKQAVSSVQGSVLKGGADRAAFDELLKKEVSKNITQSVMEVDHQNAPAGVSISTEGPLFDNHKMSRTSAPMARLPDEPRQIYPSAEDHHGGNWLTRNVLSPAAAAATTLRGGPEPIQGTGVGGVRG